VAFEIRNDLADIDLTLECNAKVVGDEVEDAKSKGKGKKNRKNSAGGKEQDA